MRKLGVVMATAVLAATVAEANPIIATLVNEVEVAPDSQEWLEVNTRYWPDPYLDLSGWTITSRAGSATVNSGIVVPNESSSVVIDRTNTTGTFQFTDDYDEIHLISPDGVHDLMLAYPGDPAGYFWCWRPAPGQSCCRHAYWEGMPEPDLIVSYYLDATPTPGQPNDDSLGGIFGRITNQLAQPVCSARVHVGGIQGGAVAFSDPAGYYSFAPTGPGTFWVAASRAGYTSGYYPDSVHVATNETRNDVNITLSSVSVLESGRRFSPLLEWQGNVLDVKLCEAADADLRTVNMLGQVCWSLHVRLRAGTNRLAPVQDQPSGVYLVQGRVGAESVNRRITFVR